MAERDGVARARSSREGGGWGAWLSRAPLPSAVNSALATRPRCRLRRKRQSPAWPGPGRHQAGLRAGRGSEPIP